jgi:hypothetical protein
MTVLAKASSNLLNNRLQQPQPSVAQACPATVGEMNAPPPPLRHNQQRVPSRSVHAPNANTSSLNDMFKVIATIVPHIMTEFNGAVSEEGTIMAIKNSVKTHRAK